MNDGQRTDRFLTGDRRRRAVLLLKAMPVGVDWFLPPQVLNGDADLLRRSRLVVAFNWILVPLAIVYAIIYLSMNSPIGGGTLGMGVVASVGSLWVMRRTGSLFAAGNLLTAACFAMLTALACRLGGHGSPVLPWYALVPVVALSTAGRRSAVFWLAVTSLSLVVFYALAVFDCSLPNDLTPHRFDLLGMLGGVGLALVAFCLALLHDMAKDRMMRLVQEGQQRYRAVVEDTPLLICTYLPDTTLTFVNEAYCCYYQRPREALLGRSFLELIPEEEHAAVRRMIAGLTTMATACVSENRGLALDGTVGWLRWTNRAILDRDGRLVSCQAIGEDVTERKRAEETLRREKEMSDEIINSLPGLFYIFDESRFVRRNGKWETVTGYSAEEMEQMYGTDFFQGADRELIANQMRAVFREGAAEAEARIMTKDGRMIPFYFTGLRCMLDGKPHLIGFGVDITELKQTEAELAKARNEAEAATQAKSAFLANMSHEIRTPMTAILGFSEILMGNATDREQLDAAATIKQNGEYLLRIINDVLDLSKIEAGKMEVERIDCSPCQILSEVVSLMRVRANAKNLPLKIEYDGPIPQTIRSDPTRLRQILINIIGNAVKFTEVGTLRLVASLLDAESDVPRMQFRVVDSGIGMTEKQTAKLFNPFSQVDSSTTRKHGGTGLGLAISKRLAETLGGDITVQSAAGEGSTFTVTVATGSLDGVKLLDKPTEAQSPTDSDKWPAASRVTLDCRVLLAEDGPDNQRLIAFLLKKAGAEVVVADHGQIACELALAARDAGAPFDVILMDMQMPVMDGYDATGNLRKAGYAGPIIALTAHAMSTDREKCFDAGCDDYATKPIDRERLISLIAKYALPQRLSKTGDTPAS